MEMEAEKVSGNEPSTDLTSHLSNLIEAGWTEQQIAKFARMRATYSPVNDVLTPAAMISADKNRLDFARWLYNNGRLVS